MISQFDKALVALVMAILSLVSLWTGWLPNSITEEHVAAIIAVLTPVLVYLVPNKAAA